MPTTAPLCVTSPDLIVFVAMIVENRPFFLHVIFHTSPHPHASYRSSRTSPPPQQDLLPYSPLLDLRRQPLSSRPFIAAISASIPAIAVSSSSGETRSVRRSSQTNPTTLVVEPSARSRRARCSNSCSRALVIA